MLETVAAEWARLLSAHRFLVGAVWVYLAAGVVLAAYESRRSRLAEPQKRTRWIWLMPFLPLLTLPRRLLQREPAPWESPFGVPRPAENGRQSVRSDNLLPLRAMIGTAAAALFPGLGQLAYGRLARCLLIWTLGAFALFFMGAHLLDIERDWPTPEWIPDMFKPEVKEGDTTTLYFRVERPFYIFLCIELAAVLIWAYMDAALLIDWHIGKRTLEDDERQWELYNLRIIKKDGSDERRVIDQPVFNAADVMNTEMDGRMHFSMQYDPERGLELRLFTDVENARLNGKAAADEATLHPGDLLEIDGVQFQFKRL